MSKNAGKTVCFCYFGNLPRKFELGLPIRSIQSTLLSVEVTNAKHEQGNKTMSNATTACQNILNAIATSVAGVSYGSIMTDNILDAAQQLVNDEGYAFDVALSMACKMYSKTQHCGAYAYGA